MADGTGGEETAAPAARRSFAWVLVHWAIVANLAAEVAYAGWMVLVVLAPSGGAGPLGRSAPALPYEQMFTRRLYAIEAWIAFGALAIYLAITEIGPRLAQGRARR